MKAPIAAFVLLAGVSPVGAATFDLLAETSLVEATSPATTIASDSESSPTDPVSASIAPDQLGNAEFDGGTGEGRAQLNGLGIGFVRADAGFAFPNNDGDRQTLDARTTFTRTETIGGSVPRRLLANFAIYGGVIDMAFAFGGPSTPNPFVDPASETTGGSIDFQIQVNGNPVYRSRADVFGRNVFPGPTPEFTIDTSASIDGTAPDGSIVSGTPTYTTSIGPNNNFLVEFDAKLDQLLLGTFNPGETVDIDVILAATATAIPFERGLRVDFIDPTGVSGSGLTSVTQQPVSVIPLPAGILLLPTALGALVMFRRRSA